MIFVERTEEPVALRRNKQRWQQKLADAPTKETREKAQEKYRHKQIQEVLRDQMFHGKCAYCETFFAHTAHGHIEHFWPKAQYPEKTFEWENLLWACPICNSDLKNDVFPLEGEAPVLVDPTRDRPEEHFHFVWDEVAKLATLTEKTERGRVSKELYDLNRQALRKDRSEYVEKLMAIAAYLPNPEAADILRKACQASSEYSAFAQMLMSKKNV